VVLARTLYGISLHDVPLVKPQT